MNTRHSKGFTLIELMLAVGLGAIVIMIASGIFIQIDRTEAMLKARSEQTNDLERLRFVVQRVTSSLVMSNEPQVAREQGEEVDGASRTARNRNARDPLAPLPAPRLLVEPDPRLSGLAMYSTGGNQFARDGVRPQRFEAVVSDAPVPQREPLDVFIRAGIKPGERLNRAAMAGALRGDVSGSNRRAMDARGGSGTGSTGGAGEISGVGGGSGEGAGGEGAAGEKRSGGKSSGGRFASQGGQSASADGRGSPAGTAVQETEVPPVRAFRGAFELRPMPLSQGQIDDAKVQGVDVEQAWEMWWVPLPPRKDMNSTPSEYELAAAGDPYLVASNLRFVKWMLFDDGEEKQAISSTWTSQLPAYIELSVETTAGLTSKWLFEVDWGQGPEVAQDPQDLGPKRATAVDESGQSGNQSGGQPGNQSGTPGRPNLRPKTNEKGNK